MDGHAASDQLHQDPDLDLDPGMSDTVTVASEPQAQEADQPPRKRARLSCNACKSRKTKCVGIEDGSCRHCTSMGIPCETDLKSRKRPFYRVSEDVYEHSIKLLRKFVPEHQLPELTVANIQSVLQRIEQGERATADKGATESPLQPPLFVVAGTTSTRTDQHASSHLNSHHVHVPINPDLQVNNLSRASNSANQVMEADEHPILQEELGCMLLDSMGKYRYVGADSSIRWNHAARMTLARDVTAMASRSAAAISRPAADNSTMAGFNIIAPLKSGLLPPTSPETAEDTASRGPGTSSSSVKDHRREPMYLPPRQLCMAYAARFFDQIHCLYWFYTSHQFYTALDQTLANGGTAASASWLCSLYSILAMGSTKPSSSHEDAPSQASGAPADAKSSLDYLAMARQLSTLAADEADIDSIKAFGLLSLATHATCHSVTAYLHLGTAVRIGFSLGLHRDVSPKSRDSLEREWGRRLWWTIYVLDHEMASRFGYPCSVVDDSESSHGDGSGGGGVFMRTPPATEQILDPGPNTPLGFQALLVNLVRLRKRSSHDCFLQPAQAGGRLPISRVTSCLAALRHWYDHQVPLHLRWDVSLHPQHRRAVSLLHLRYWTSVIAITRPFLLFLLNNGNGGGGSGGGAQQANSTSPDNNVMKMKLYANMSHACVAAAESAVKVLERMRQDKTLSSLMLLDVQCIGEFMWVLVLELKRNNGRASSSSKRRREMLVFCLETLRGMERLGWCEKVLPELEAIVHESGVLEPAAPSAATGRPDNDISSGGMSGRLGPQLQLEGQLGTGGPEEHHSNQLPGISMELMTASLEENHGIASPAPPAAVAGGGGSGTIVNDDGSNYSAGLSSISPLQWDPYAATSNADALQLDVFETLGFTQLHHHHGSGPGAARHGWMDSVDGMFMDASFSASQFLFDTNFDGVYYP